MGLSRIIVQGRTLLGVPTDVQVDASGVVQTAGGGGGSAVTIADGADVAEGLTTDVAVVGDVAGTVSGKLRGLTKILNSVWDSVNGRLKVDGSGVTQPVSGTFWQAVQPVNDNGGSLTVDAPVGIPIFARLSDGTAVLVGQKPMATSLPVTLASDQSVLPAVTECRAATLAVTVTAATGVAATLSLPAAGVGLFHYISLIEIELYATAARTGGATPVLVTTTNLPGSPVWDFDTGQAIGTTIRKTIQPATPIKSSVANTATTIVAPIATTGIWRITAYYFVAA